MYVETSKLVVKLKGQVNKPDWPPPKKELSAVLFLCPPHKSTNFHLASGTQLLSYRRTPILSGRCLTHGKQAVPCICRGRLWPLSSGLRSRLWAMRSLPCHELRSARCHSQLTQFLPFFTYIYVFCISVYVHVFYMMRPASNRRCLFSSISIIIKSIDGRMEIEYVDIPVVNSGKICGNFVQLHPDAPWLIGTEVLVCKSTMWKWTDCPRVEQKSLRGW